MDMVDIIRPMLLLALTAFLIGFIGCLAFSDAPSRAQATAVQPAYASGPVSADWNLEKSI